MAEIPMKEFVNSLKERIEKLESQLKPMIEETFPALDTTLAQLVTEVFGEDRLPKEECEHVYVSQPDHSWICKECGDYKSNRAAFADIEKPKDSRCEHWNSNWDACEILDEHKRDKEIERLKSDYKLASDSSDKWEEMWHEMRERKEKALEQFSLIEAVPTVRLRCTPYKLWLILKGVEFGDEILEGKS